MKTILFYFLLVMIFSCTEDLDSNIYGCMNKDACNYIPKANKDDNSCVYYNEETEICSDLIWDSHLAQST